MAEDSYLWTTGGAGDGAAVYSRVDTSDFMRILGACHGWEGVAPDFLNKCVGTVPAANTARIASGGALVDGKPYLNTANVDVAIPSAVGAGNTRIDRIVLRASWAAQTVRITRIAGVDAAIPAAPAITQIPGTTYDIMLYQALVTTAGVVTLTDERVYARVTTDGLANLGVTGAKIAADSVDDTKAGNRVPQFYRRQGGSATEWHNPGANNYTPTAVRMQAGCTSVLIPDGADEAGVAVNFPVAFSDKPLVVATAQSNSAGFRAWAMCTLIQATDATIVVVRKDTAGNETMVIHWLAVGPE